VPSLPLTTVRGGISRQRLKGGALRDALYTLVNGYVTSERTVKVRPGTTRNSLLNANTKGLVSFQGLLHVFSHIVVTVPTGYRLNLLAHPESDANAPIAIEKIHFAAPYLGYLYVVAEFVDGKTFHFWLQRGAAWSANRVYKNNDIVTPATSSGLSFQASRLGAPNQQWTPNTQRSLSDRVEPTVYNDFYYEVVDVQGSNPRSGTTEPNWPTADGQQVTEDADGSTVVLAAPSAAPPPALTPAPEIISRYNFLVQP
jgi:hypothetical protein